MIANNLPSIYVIERILHLLTINGPLKKTNLQMFSRLNYNVFKRYINYMLNLRLIDVMDKNVLKITDLGRETFIILP